MNNALKKKISHTIGMTVLLSLIAHHPTHASPFETIEGFRESDFNLGVDFSSVAAPETETEQQQQQQMMDQVQDNYLLVLGLIKKKQYDKANEKITTLIQQNPNQSIYYNLKALLQLANKDLGGAELSFREALTVNAKNAHALISLAKITLNNKQFELAEHYANKVLAINPHAAKAYLILADVIEQQQGIGAVEKLLLDAREKIKNNPKTELIILQALGKVYLTKKQPEKLQRLAKEFIDRDKNNIFALAFLAEVQLASKDEKAAEKTLRKIIAQHPEYVKYTFLLINLLDKQKDKEAEMLSLLDKVALNMNSPTLVSSYKTAILTKQKKYKQAFAIAQQVDKSNSGQSIGKVLKGNVYLAEKKYPDALQNYQRAYQITPSIRLLDAMLNIYTLQNKTGDAIALLEKELTTNKNNHTFIQYRLAAIYLKAGQLNLSIRQYETLLAKQSDNSTILNNLAWAYNQQNNPKKALKTAEKAYNLAPKSSAVADTYGYILLKNGNKPESLKVLKQASSLNPLSPEIQLHLAEAYIANQQTLPAKDILEQLVSKESTEKEKATQLLEKIKSLALK